jgi:malate synthase
VRVEAEDLLRVPTGTRTEAGLRHTVRVGVQYLEAWLRGLGCVPLYGLMEDAATAEIARTQVWQWIHHAATLEDGRRVTPRLFREVLEDEISGLGVAGLVEGRLAEARALFEALSVAPMLHDFLTLPAYDLLLTPSPRPTPPFHRPEA